MGFKLHSIVLEPADLGAAVTIGDISSSSIDNQPEVMQERSSGEQYPWAVDLMGTSPDLLFESMALKKVIDAVGTGGLCAAGGNGIKAYLQNIDPCGKPAASGHREYAFSNGLLVIEAITAPHREYARARCRLFGIAATGAGPTVAVTTGATLPTNAHTQDRWTLGPAEVAGATLADYSNLEIDFGNQIQKRATQSDIAPIYIEQRETSPVVNLTGVAPDWYDGLTESGVAASHANTKIYLRKKNKAQPSTFDLPVTTAHILFTAAGVAVPQQVYGGGDANFVEHGLQLTTVFDGTTLPLVMQTDQAIT